MADILLGDSAGEEFPAIYMACGTEDSLLEKNNALAEVLKSHGVSFTFETGPGAHEWDFWDRYILKALTAKSVL